MKPSSAPRGRYKGEEYKAGRDGADLQDRYEEMNWIMSNHKSQISLLNDSLLLDCNEHLLQEDIVKDGDMDITECKEPASLDKNVNPYFQKPVQLPFLPPLPPEDSPSFRKYALVLDLDETLIHSSMV